MSQSFKVRQRIEEVITERGVHIVSRLGFPPDDRSSRNTEAGLSRGHSEASGGLDPTNSKQ